MNPSKDDRRILAEMERSLPRDDPGLVALMDVLNRQFPDDQDAASNDSDSPDHPDSDTPDTGSPDADGGWRGRRDWRRKGAAAFAVLLVVMGLVLTALFSRSPRTDGKDGSSNDRTPTAPLHTQSGIASRGRALAAA